MLRYEEQGGGEGVGGGGQQERLRARPWLHWVEQVLLLSLLASVVQKYKF
jgi:hypothetical protein